MRDTFVFRKSFLECRDVMSDSQFAEYITALCDYALDGTEPDSTDKLIMAFFNSNKRLIDASNNRYDKCVENGKYGVLGKEFGKKGGRPRKGETKEEYKERKNNEKPPKTPLKGNNENPLIKTPENPLYVYDNVYEYKNKDVYKDNNININNDNKKEKVTSNINIQLPKEKLESIFRDKLKEKDNRKWVTDSSTFEISLFRNQEFKDWVTLNGYDQEEIKRLWDKFRVIYLSNQNKRVQTPRVEITNVTTDIGDFPEEPDDEEYEEEEEDLRLSTAQAPIEVIDVSEGTNKEIYDYLKDKKEHGWYPGLFRVEYGANPRSLGEWMSDNGYSYDLVEKIFNQISREMGVTR